MQSSPQKSSGRVSVLVPVPTQRAIYDYKLNQEDDHAYQVGDYVAVPFGNRTLYGMIWSLAPTDPALPPEKLKIICSRPSVMNALPALPQDHLKFMAWMANYTLAPLGMIAKLTIGMKDIFKDFKRAKPLSQVISPESADQSKALTPAIKQLSSAQQQAAAGIIASLSSAKFSVSLLDGVTGSGKTEVYFQAIAENLARNRQSVILLPEIALSSHFLTRIKTHFGIVPTLWHSDLTPATRRKAWHHIATGKAKIVLGARSALFLPFQSLGLVVVDEEHDASYKQSDGVCYHARDMAVMRAKYANAAVILASATPSLESLVNAQQEKYDHYQLPDRYGGASLPKLVLIDLTKQQLKAQHFISLPLQQAIKERLALQQQSLLFLNRRGYAPLLLCRHCGYRFACPHCSAWLVAHRYGQGPAHEQHTPPYLACHHCGFKQLMPDACPECDDTEALAACGPGVERLEQEAAALFPHARIAIASAETLHNSKQAEAFIEQVHANEIDIIIGTQIIAKGYHFPKLTLVGVIDADLGLQGGDLRAGERCYQLMHQVAGRAGRADLKGEVLLQT
ncbi:MAG: primosomal protein N', partial [Alphaproteobacteria bacterium]